MIQTFYKYQGTGNDFVMIDGRQDCPALSQPQIAALCHRRFGIGADGLIILKKHAEYVFYMDYYNSDGHPSTMCGNGGRCLVKFAHDLGVFDSEVTFLAVDGPHFASIKNDQVHLQMIDVAAIEQRDGQHFAQTGSPHVVSFVRDIKNYEVFATGKAIRNSDYWLQHNGTNVNFVEKTAENGLFVRTYERGVEDETYSCGTGVTAAALVANNTLNLSSPIDIVTLGGQLSVAFSKKDSGYTQVFLIGSATFVFKGEVEI